jgi:hypothetical protein
MVESFEVVVELIRERRNKDTAAATVAVGYFTVSERVRASWRGFRHKSECRWECCSYDATAWWLFLVSISRFVVRRFHLVSEGTPEWDCALVVPLTNVVS